MTAKLNHSAPRPGRPCRVLFIVPGEQDGRDGITDYTFWVAAAAGRAGVDCMIFALFPFENSREIYAPRFPASGPGHLIVKIASAGPLRHRLAQLESAVREFQPDWINLQFTPGTFRDGRFFLPSLLTLARIFRRQTAPICLTAHESARVLISGNTWRNRALGYLRRFEIETGLKKLRPAKVFVSNSQHGTDLARAGLAPTPLPILSNIPRGPRPESSPGPEVPVDVRIALIFGRISVDWNPYPVLSALAAETGEASGPLAIVSVGEVGHRDLGWQSVVRVATTLGLSTHRLGTLPSETISSWMQCATYGISPTPFALWQKSGACAAMLLHDLPMIFSDETPNDGQLLPPRFASIQGNKLEWLDAPKARRAVPTTPDELWAKMALR